MFKMHVKEASPPHNPDLINQNQWGIRTKYLGFYDLVGVHMHMNLGIIGKGKRTASEATLTLVHTLARLPLGYVTLSKLFSLFFNSKLGKIKPT